MKNFEGKQMLSYFEWLLKKLLLEKGIHSQAEQVSEEELSPENITEEYRKILDKVAIKMIYKGVFKGMDNGLSLTYSELRILM